MSRGRRAIRRVATLASLSLIVPAATGRADDAVAPSATLAQPGAVVPSPAPAPATTTWVDAVTQTKAKGLPTLLVVTSRTAPASAVLARSLAASAAMTRLRGVVQVAELCAEDEPDQVRRLVVTRYPTYVGLRRGAGGELEVAGSRTGAMSPDEVAGWLWGVGLVTATEPPAANDPGVSRAGLLHGHHPPSPSPQYPTPPSPVKVVPVAPPPEREVVVERPVEREVVVERPVEREVVVEREVEVERPVEREVVVERAPRRTREVTTARRNVLTRTVPAREREVVVERPAPREREVVREVVVERAVPREREVVREVVPSRVRTVEYEEERPALTLIRPGVFGRCFGLIGEKLRVAGLPRVDVPIEREPRYRAALPREKAALIAEPARRVYATEEAPRTVCAPAPPTAYCPPPQPPYAPSPQSR